MTDTTTQPDAVAAAPEAHEAEVSDRRSPGEWLRSHSRAEVAVWVGLIVLAVVLRVWDLGSRPFHHDESQDAYFSYTFSQDFKSYSYNPLLHGPVRFYLTALNYKLFGDSNFTARLAPVYMGTLLVGLPYLLRHQMGRVAAIAAGLILAISPSVLYFSRFAREDIYLAAVSLGLFVACFRFVRKPRTLTLCLIGFLISFSFGVKESGLVTTFIVGGFFITAVGVQGILAQRRGGAFTDGEVLGAIAKVGWPAWVSSIAVLVFTYSFLFTRFFTGFTCTTTEYAGHPAHQTSCLDGVFYGLGYWQAQQKVARGGDSAWLYPGIIFSNEWPVLLLAVVGVVFTFLRPSLLRFFALWMFVCTLAFYMWGSERFAWLVLHPLVPLVLLAGIGLQSLWELRSRIARGGAFAAVAIGAAYLIFASFETNARDGAIPRSWVVSTQSSVQVKQVTDQIAGLIAKAKAEGQPQPGITIDSSSGATFPYAWYLRHDAPGYIDMTTQGFVPNTSILIMTQEGREALRPSLSAYSVRPFDFRVWWVKDYKKKFSFTAWKNWFAHRTPWNTTGGLKEFFATRTELGTVPGKGTKSAIPEPKPAPKAR